jgi:hypothetical protein
VFGRDNWHLSHIAAISEEEREIQQTEERKKQKALILLQHFTVFSTGKKTC